MNIRHAPAPVLALLIAGCVTSPMHANLAAEGAELPSLSADEIVMVAEEAPRMVCRREAPTGSHRKVTRCRTSEQIEKDRNAAQDQLRRRTSLTHAAGRVH